MRGRIGLGLGALAVLAGLVIGLVVASTGAGPVAPAAATAAVADPPGPLRVYSIVLDGLKPQEVTPTLMPTVAALRAQGTWYEQARAVFPAETLPNHVAMMTGKLPQDNGVIANQWYPGSAVKGYMSEPRHYLHADTVPTRLEDACRARGDVATAMVQSKTYLDTIFTGEPASAEDPHRQRQADFHWEPAPVIPQSDHAPDVFTMEAFLGWMRAQDQSLPQFAFVNFGDIDRSGHADAFGSVTAGGLTAARQGALRDTDEQVKLLVDELVETGAWDDTVLLFTSDHNMDWSPNQNGIDPPLTDGFLAVDGGGSVLIYAKQKAAIAPMARRLSTEDGVAVVATREPVPGLDNPTLDEMGIDHPASPDIELFAKPGWRSFSGSGNPLPGNHGHPVTQQSTLLVAGGHPALGAPQSVPGLPVYDVGVPEARRFSRPEGGPGNLSVAPTVAALFGLGEPDGGYARPPLAEAFDPGALDRATPLCGDAPAPEPAPDTRSDQLPSEAQAPGPLLTAGVEVISATAREATFELTAFNHGGQPAPDVTISAPVLQGASFGESDTAPADPSTCAAGAAGGTGCTWAVGTVPAVGSRRVRVTYRLADSPPTSAEFFMLTATVAAPGLNTNSHTDDALRRQTEVVQRDALVDPADTLNRGACAELRSGAGGVTSLLTSDLPTDIRSSIDYDGRLLAAEVSATVEEGTGVSALAVHSLAPVHWDEGAGTCAGTPGQGAEVRGGQLPPVLSEPAAETPVAGPGRITWDVTSSLDTEQDRFEFNGFALRPAGSVADGGSVRLASRESVDEAARPRLTIVYTEKQRQRACIDADAESVERPSDREPVVVAQVTDGLERVAVEGGDACSGDPAANMPVRFEWDVPGPDAWFSDVEGTDMPPEPLTGGGLGPDLATGLTDAAGRTFVRVRVAQPYVEGANAGDARLAALIDHFDIEGKGRPSRGTQCEPEAEPATNCPSMTGESLNEDDVRITWTAATAPPPPDGDDDGGDGGGGDGGGDPPAGPGAAASGSGDQTTAPSLDRALPKTGRCANARSGSARVDLLRGSALGDRLLGLRGADVLRGLAGDDCLLGGAGGDRLFGGPGADGLFGGSGPDLLVGGAGTDVLRGGNGADRLLARDGRRDLVACGYGRDRAVVDALDRVVACERVRRR